MASFFEENELCDLMIEVELMLEYRNFKEASVRLEKILLEHPEYLPAKEAMQEIYRLTGQAKRAQDLEREIRALTELKAKASLSTSAREEYARIESRQFAEKVERLTRVIYQGRTVEEVLLRTAMELLETLKADRCLVYLADEDSGCTPHVYNDPAVSQEVDPSMHEFILSWLQGETAGQDPLVRQKMQSDPACSEAWPLLAKHEVHSMMGFPLLYKSAPIGWLVVQQCVPYYVWNEGDLTLFSTACGHLATAIQNVRSFSALQEKAYKDTLTGLHNRHFLEERLSVELANAQRHHYPLSLAILDIDHFKQINDTYGHAAGDAVLTKLAFLLKTSVRKSCLVARWGGEEFLAVLPRIEVEAATLIMDRFREKLCQTLEVGGRPVSISAGVAQARLNTREPIGQIEKELIDEADSNLYEAKRNGRNQVVASPPPLDQAANPLLAFQNGEEVELLNENGLLGRPSSFDSL